MLALTDPAEIAEATSADCQKNNLKALMFPTMDEPDAFALYVHLPCDDGLVQVVMQAS